MSAHPPSADPERGRRIRELHRRHVFSSWVAQGSFDPVPLAGGEGARLWDHDGNSWIDLTSQLVNANLGYNHPRLVAAIQEAAGDLATVSPGFAHESRAEAARMVAEVAPEGMDRVYFTTGGAEAVEHAIRMARSHTGRLKVLASYRSYHGATSGAASLTGEPRRWGAEPGLPGVVHFWGPHLYRTAFHASTEEEESQRALEHLRATVLAEGPHLVAAVVLETVAGSPGVLVPPPGYLEGVRALCDEFGILLVLDEVMAGFGRTGRWLALDRGGVRPDLLTIAKGVNSGYVPLGGVVLGEHVARSFDDRPYPGGSTYQGHPLACASAVAAMTIMKEEGTVEHADRVGEEVLGPGLRDLVQRHQLVGDVRGLGVFWAVELVADRATREPVGGEVMGRVLAACRERGAWPLVMGNRLHVVPPCVITQDEASQAVAAVDGALQEVGS